MTPVHSYMLYIFDCMYVYIFSLHHTNQQTPWYFLPCPKFANVGSGGSSGAPDQSGEGAATSYQDMPRPVVRWGIPSTIATKEEED